jgi:hypothetical protein
VSGALERGAYRPHEPRRRSFRRQQQRVAIAWAIHQPAAAPADEPTGKLDSKSGGEIIKMLHELHAQAIRSFLSPRFARRAGGSARMAMGRRFFRSREARAAGGRRALTGLLQASDGVLRHPGKQMRSFLTMLA